MSSLRSDLRVDDRPNVAQTEGGHRGDSGDFRNQTIFIVKVYVLAYFNVAVIRCMAP